MRSLSKRTSASSTLALKYIVIYGLAASNSVLKMIMSMYIGAMLKNIFHVLSVILVSFIFITILVVLTLDIEHLFIDAAFCQEAFMRPLFDYRPII